MVNLCGLAFQTSDQKVAHNKQVCFFFGPNCFPTSTVSSAVCLIPTSAKNHSHVFCLDIQKEVIVLHLDMRLSPELWSEPSVHH